MVLLFLAGFGALETEPWRSGAPSSEDTPGDSQPWKNAIDFCCKPLWLDFGTGRVNTDTGIYWYYSVEQGHFPKTEGLCTVTPKVTLL